MTSARRLFVAVLATLTLAGGGVAAGADPGWVNRALRQMTLEEKVGQLFVLVAYGADADAPDQADAAANRAAYGVDTAAQVVDRYAPGGLIYFTWSHNLNTPQQIATLSNGVQRAALAPGGGTPVPLLVSTDQEHGIVVRVGPPATQFPGAMALGAGRSGADAYTAAAVTGRELRALGINNNYAPVADVNVNPVNPVIGVRSFSSDPALASQLTAAQILGLQQGSGVVATAKHFPGHGDTSEDSHTTLPTIGHSAEEWERIDAPPFRAAIAAGIDMIMTAHIVVPALDPAEDPATLSRPILTGVLRERLRYDGVVVTDALTMAGVRTKYGDDRVPVLALKAGADMLLMPPDMDVAYQAVLAAVRSGELSRSRIDQSVRRILRLKLRRGLVDRPFVDPGRTGEVVGIPTHLAAAQRVSDAAVTAVRNDVGLLPLASADRSMLVTGWDASTTRPIATLAERLAARGARSTALPTGTRPDDAAIAAAAAAAAQHDLTVVLTSRAWDTTVTDPAGRQQLLVRRLLETGRPVVVVAVRDPYDIAYFTAAPTYLATYSSAPAVMESLARVLVGELSPRGRLPVTIPVAGDPATALYPFGHGLSW